MIRRSLPGPLLVLLTASCGSGARSGFAGEVGTYDADAGLALSANEGGGTAALDAHIEEDRLAVTSVTVSCSGGCATVEAVGTGGFPPYGYVWDDGSTSATKQICPASTTRYAVTVKDTGSSGEIARAPQTARASVTAEVLACPEGGLSDAGGGPACFANPSFEGVAALRTGTNFDAPPWIDCTPALFDGPQIGNAGVVLMDQTWTSPAPTDGQTYLLLDENTGFGANGVSEPLCTTVPAGTTFGLEVDLASPLGTDTGSPAGSPAALRIYGATASCGTTQLLWTSPPASPAWQTYCATMTVPQDTAYLTLQPDVPSGATGILYVDHLVAVASCP